MKRAKNRRAFLGKHRRANYIGAPEFFNLNHAVLPINEAFDECCFLVGSSLVRRNHRDVDVRMMLDDDKYDALFPGKHQTQWHDPLWSLLSASISGWLSERTGLKIDFQIQRRTNANKEFDGERCALGIFFGRRRATPEKE